MTSITQRIAALFRIKANKALDRAEDPRKVLDYSHEKQLEMLQKVRRGVADVATSRKRVELQVNELRQSTGKLQDQAQQALAAGRQDLEITPSDLVLSDEGTSPTQVRQLLSDDDLIPG